MIVMGNRKRHQTAGRRSVSSRLKVAAQVNTVFLIFRDFSLILIQTHGVRYIAEIAVLGCSHCLAANNRSRCPTVTVRELEAQRTRQLQERAEVRGLSFHIRELTANRDCVNHGRVAYTNPAEQSGEVFVGADTSSLITLPLFCTIFANRRVFNCAVQLRQLLSRTVSQKISKAWTAPTRLRRRSQWLGIVQMMGSVQHRASDGRCAVVICGVSSN